MSAAGLNFDMGKALREYAARAGGDLVPREAEFFEAGYAAGAIAAQRQPADDWCPECHALNSAEPMAAPDLARIAIASAPYLVWIYVLFAPGLYFAVIRPALDDRRQARAATLNIEATGAPAPRREK